jgi:metal-responsive CopG/Arc/MetJ family transcriptional regulator
MTNKVPVKEIRVCLPENLLNALSDYCSQKGCSRSSFIRKAIEQYLEDQEDYEDVRSYQQVCVHMLLSLNFKYTYTYTTYGSHKPRWHKASHD